MALFSEIAQKLSRIFLGRIIVRSLGDIRRAKPARIDTHFRGVEVKSLRTEPRVNAAMFVQWKKTRAKSAGALFGGKIMKKLGTEGMSFGHARKLEVKRWKFNLKRRASPRHGMALMHRTPSTRRNRVTYLKKPPKFERATLLALYSPIFQEKVTKSALDKASGNLLFWYDNKRVKMGEKSHLLLLRVFGGGEPLKWMWLPADKKIG
ncbi:MAG: hypothetical protein LBS35_01320 [Synergistaceae bacterium]|jgi:hypothetical protein|nr:hypothetical protein [Synergistaceae bacterium]